MNRKIGILLLGFLLIGSAVAGLGLLSRNKSVAYEDDITDALTTKNISTWSFEDEESADFMQRCLISPSEYNLPCSGLMETYWMNCTAVNLTSGECSNYVRVNYTEDEKKNILDSWEQKRMNQIGSAINQRENKQTLTKIADGVTTPTQDRK